MSELAQNVLLAPSERQDFRIRDLLSKPRDIELFDQGSIAGEQYYPLLEGQGTFADEVIKRIDRVGGEARRNPAITREPAFILGVVSSVSARRESMQRSEPPSSMTHWEGTQ